MELTFYQIDAFADRLFSGNPAAVFILSDWLPEPIMQAIAMEINLSETAFVIPKGNDFRIRWFTPTREIKLCGHATLASAHVLTQYYDIAHSELRFHSLSGILTTTVQGNDIELNFPSNPVIPVSMPEGLKNALGGNPKETWANDDLIVVYDDPAEVKILEPKLQALGQLPYRGICATAPCNESEFDFIARFFAPAYGIDEDPVTGSLYTQLTPFYSDRLNKTEFFAYQASKRGGKIRTTLKKDRVLIAGKAVTAMKSVLYINI